MYFIVNHDYSVFIYPVFEYSKCSVVLLLRFVFTQSLLSNKQYLLICKSNLNKCQFNNWKYSIRQFNHDSSLADQNNTVNTYSLNFSVAVFYVHKVITHARDK